MRSISLFFFFLLSAHFLFAQNVRKLDLEINTVLPLTGDTISSPSSYTASFSVTNNGADTFWPGERVKVSPNFGGIFYGIFPFTIGKPLFPGEHDSFVMNLNAFGLFAMPTTFCWTIEGVLYSNNGDSIDLSTEIEYNNQSCVDVYHGLLDNSVISNKTKDKVLIYPNPTEKAQLVKLEIGHNNYIQKIELFDLAGRKVHFTNCSKPENQVTLSVHNLSAGIYSIHVHSTEGVITQRLLVN